MWVRGLKLYHILVTYLQYASHPVWVRGLKHLSVSRDHVNRRSHPVWVRGLKLELVDDISSRF